MVVGTNSKYGTCRNLESVTYGFQEHIEVPNPTLSAMWFTFLY